MITWNAKAAQYLSPLQRDAYERGQTPRRLEGKITTDDAGRVWYGSGGNQKLVGESTGPTAPAPEDAAERNLDAPTGKPAKAPRKPKAKRK